MRKFIRNDEIVEIDYINTSKSFTFVGPSSNCKIAYVSKMLTEFIDAGRTVITIDFLQEDGTSSISEYADYFGSRATYIDVGSESNNIMQLPDMRKYSPRDREYVDWYLNDYLRFLLSGLFFNDTQSRHYTLGKLIIGAALRLVGVYFPAP